MLGITAGSGSSGGGGGPFDIDDLFALGEDGGYWDFTDGATLAVNADGTGGTPALNASCKWASDLSPNANHLRNTVSTVTRRTGGIETDGAGYGLFNMAGFGNWPSIAQPFEVFIAMQLLAAETTDDRIIGSGGANLLAGTASGKVRGFAGSYGTEFTPGLTTDFTLDLLFHGASSLAGMNTDSPSASADPGGGSLDALAVGSGTGGTVATALLVKRLVVLSRALTAGERTGVYAWLTA